MEPVDLLSKNLDLFLRIKKLAEEQLSLLERDKIEGFQALSLQREHLQHEISRYQKKYEALIKNSPDDRTRTRLRGVSIEIAEVIRSIKDIDQSSEELILEKRNAVISDMKGLRLGQKSLKGYGRKASSIPRFIDRQS